MRQQVRPLRHLDPLTGAVLRQRASHRRYEYDRPGGLIHLDIKKLGRIPDGGGWRVHGRREDVRGRGIGYDFVHVAVDDRSRAAYAEILGDERGSTYAGFLVQPHPANRMGLPPTLLQQHRPRQHLAIWLTHYNTDRPHTALDGQPPISRLSPT